MSPFKKSVANRLMEAFAAFGARQAFGIPGIHSLALYDAIATNSAIRHVTARHEQGAGYMAEGYARASGQPSLLLTIGGPGATNALTAIADAYADSVPLVHLSTQVPTNYIGTRKGYLHAVRNQLGVFESVVENAYRISHVDETLPFAARAWTEALGPPGRPVYLEVPLDVLEQPSSEPNVAPSFIPHRSIDFEGPIDRAAHLLQTASRPIIYAGGGINSERASGYLTALAEVLRAPVVTTTKGKGAIPADHPLHLGCSWAPTVRNSHWLLEADVVLAVGTRLSRRTYDLFGELKLPTSLIHLDADPSIIGINHPVSIRLVGEVSEGLEHLLRLLRQRPNRTEMDPEVTHFREQTHRSARDRAPKVMSLLEAVSAALGADVITTHDLNTISVWAAFYFPVRRPRHFLFPMEFGPLGFSLPAAIGAKLARPHQPVAAFTGDGSFLFSLQELSTAVQEKIQVLVFVFNDSCYGSVARFQRTRYGRTIGTDIVNPDFVALAQSFGAQGFRCHNVLQLPTLVDRAFSYEGPTVVEIPIETDWVG